MFVACVLQVSILLQVPQDPSVLRKNIYFCPSCNSYLPSTEFAISSNSRNVGKCRRCTKIDNDARVRQDYSHYRYLLKLLRKAEEQYGDGSKIAFLLQVLYTANICCISIADVKCNASIFACSYIELPLPR